MFSRRVITADDAARLRVPSDAGESAPSRPGEGRAIAASPGGADLQAGPDDYSSKLLKLIPAEAVTVFVAIDNVMQAKPELGAHGLYWAIALLLAAGSYLYTFRQSAVPGLRYPHRQAMISTVAFAVWILAIGGPFRLSFGEAWSPLYGTIILPLFTFFVPLMIEPTLAKGRNSAQG